MQATSRRATASRLRQVAARAEASNAASKRESARRLAGLLTVAAASVVVVTAAAVASPRPAVRGATATARSAQRSTTAVQAAAGNVRRHQAASVSAAAPPVPPPPLTLTALDRESCPAKATACVDLTRHLTWLQSAGKITFGPIQAEPGPPGSAHATPRGTFQVSWKGGPGFVSNIYHEPMPWPVFFASGGIAFHGGSLTIPSHGCVHLTDQNARYYNDHLPVGAEVVVF
jgi:hypothetical protein